MQDLILYGGKIITLDRHSRICEAIAVRNGQITGVGNSAEILKGERPNTKAIDLAGRTVIPGLFDAHPHMDREGLKARGGISIEGAQSVAEIVDIVRDAARRVPAGEWIVLMPMGTPPMGYVNQPSQLREGRFPNRHDLDEAAPDHPVYIRAPWAWWSRPPYPSIANTAALEAAEVTRDTEAPYNTTIERDAAGEPTGVFLDRNGAPILEYTLFRCVPRFTFEDRIAGIRLSAAAYNAVGTTSVYEGHGLTPNILQAYRRAHEGFGLTVRVHSPLSVPTASLNDDRVSDLLEQWASRLAGWGSGDDMLRCDGITLDVGDPEVARIIGQDYPYEQWAGHFYQSLPHDRFVKIGTMAARLGMRVNCVVCFDLERVLRAYEAIDKEVPIRGRRWVLMHIIQASPEQLQRIKALGLVTTVTPNFMYMAEDRFGLDKLRERGVPIRELLDAKIPVALSSDNVPYSMLWVMWEALARWDDDSKSRLGESRLGREEVLRLGTQTGHLLTWEEGRRGSLEIGRAADFVVLGGDPLTCAEDELKDLPVDRTFVGGRQVHGADD